MGFSTHKKGFERGIVEPPQHQNLCARQQRAVQLKRRILGGCAHQHHGAVLDHGQKTVLLAAVETVDFVDEQQRALPRPPSCTRGFKRLLEISDAGKHRRQLFETKFEGVAEETRDGRLAGARRTPQDDGMGPAQRHHPPDGAVFRQKVILAHHIGERRRAQAVRQRPRCVRGEAARFEQIAHAGSLVCNRRQGQKCSWTRPRLSVHAQ